MSTGGPRYSLPATSSGADTAEKKMRRERGAPRVRVLEGGGASGAPVTLRLERLGVTFRNQEVVRDATWDVKSGERVGLVGANGGGKTTQLKVGVRAAD